jgi:hypothetical protein
MSTPGYPWIVTSRNRVHMILVIALDVIKCRTLDVVISTTKSVRLVYVDMGLRRLNNCLIVQPFDRLGQVQHRHLPTRTAHRDHATADHSRPAALNRQPA